MVKAGYTVVSKIVVSDDKEILSKTMVDFIDNKKINLVLTTGRTGFSSRDNTPEATKAIIEKETPDISEAMRYFSMQKTNRAMLSRGISGIRGKSLIINLPGSPKAVDECLNFILEPLFHGLDILNEEDSECARQKSYWILYTIVLLILAKQKKSFIDDIIIKKQTQSQKRRSHLLYINYCFIVCYYLYSSFSLVKI